MKEITRNAPLQATLQLHAAPAILFEAGSLPAASAPGLANAFSIGVDTVLTYDMLATLANGFLAGRRFNLNEGFFAQHVVIAGCRFLGAAGKLAVEVSFTGSFNGVLFLSGTPLYNTSTNKLELQALSYDLESSNLFLKGAKWMFSKVILEEIRKHSSFDLTSHQQKAKTVVDSFLNKEWTPGMQTVGTVLEVTVTEIKAHPEHLLVNMLCTGTFALRLAPTLLSF